MKPFTSSALAVLVALAASALVAAARNSSGVETKLENGQLASDVSPGVETRDIVITRVLDAPVEQVWKAWTDPQQVIRWWGPAGFTGCESKIDFREGGRFVLCMRAPKEFQDGREFYTAGVYKKIIPMKLIEFTQGLSDKDGNAIDATSMGMPPDFPKEIPSALAFRRVGNKTELTATEYGWAVGQMREMSEAGLKECIDKLERLLAGR